MLACADFAWYFIGAVVGVSVLTFLRKAMKR